jgi:hypothetical protein
MPTGSTTGSAGYSGTPLAKKLGIKPESAVALLDAPKGWSIPGLPSGVEVRRGRDVKRAADVIVLFVRDAAALAAETARVVAAVPADGALWVAWPRRAGGHVTDVTEQSLRDQLLPTGLVDNKVAALDDDWSGLRFVWRKELRTTALPGRRSAAR